MEPGPQLRYLNQIYRAWPETRTGNKLHAWSTWRKKTRWTI